MNEHILTAMRFVKSLLVQSLRITKYIDYMMNNWNNLCFTKPIKSDDTKTHHINPKRLQREINKRIRFSSIGTKAQQALKLQHKLVKDERKVRKKETKKLEQETRYNLRKQKKKEKHKGR